MMVGQRDDPRAEPDVARALGGGGDEQLGLPIDLVPARMVFADPRLGVIELVEPLHQLEIALHAEQRILVIGMERRQKDPRAKCSKLGHAAPPSPKSRLHPYLRQTSTFILLAQDPRGEMSIDVAEWLKGLGLERYEPAFRENEIDWEALPKLTAEDLKDLGVVLGGHRRRLLDAIANLGAAETPP